MGNVNRPIVVVGSGECGVAAVGAMREAGHDGEIILIDADRELPYARPPLSKALLAAPNPLPEPIREHAWYAAQDVQLRLGCRVAGIDARERTLRLMDGTSLPYAKLLLATGASPRMLDAPGVPIHYLRTLEGALALRDALGRARRVLIVGGGVIGLEVASTAHALGVEAIVVEPSPGVMRRALSPDVSDWLLKLHRSAGVAISVSVGSTTVQRTVAGTIRCIAAGTTIDADLCVGAIGAVPDTRLAEAAGCSVADGVTVDAAGRTSVPGIFAAGDVAAFPHPLYGRALRSEAWRHAGRHGAHVARAMLGQDGTYDEVPWFWTDQHGVNIQVAGLAAEAERTVWRGREGPRTGFHFRGDQLIAATTIDNGRDMRPATKLIAARWRGDAELLADEVMPLAKRARELLALGG